MLLFKKKIPNSLYIFFIILTFNFIEFSTKDVIAKNFVVSNIEVEEKYNLNFNKLKVIDRGFQIAFQDICQMILERKDLKKIKNIKKENIKKLIENFSILDEKFINQKYKNIMEVEFNQKKLIKFLDTKNITISLPKKIEVLLIPVMVDLETNNFNYLNQNIFITNWGNIEKNYFQITYVMPNEDVEDYLTIKNNLQNIENYNFKEILKKYNSENFIIMIIFKRKNNIKFYSKINFEDKFEILSKNFIDKNIENPKNLNSIILEIKNKYEDNWKSINKMSPSTSVPIRVSVESNNTEKSLKLENALDNLDFVNNYIIEKFDNKKIVYKVYYSSNPKRFIKDILYYDINIDTTSTNWKMK